MRHHLNVYLNLVSRLLAYGITNAPSSPSPALFPHLCHCLDTLDILTHPENKQPINSHHLWLLPLVHQLPNRQRWILEYKLKLRRGLQTPHQTPPPLLLPIPLDQPMVINLDQPLIEHFGLDRTLNLIRAHFSRLRQ